MNKEFIVNNIIKDLNLKKVAVENTINLFEDGATIPFVARYRKEMTQNLDETDVRLISERLEYYKELEKRKETVLKTINEQGKLTPLLEKKILECRDKTILEDIYLPYKPKKTTKATIAKGKGLGPLADFIYAQKNNGKKKEDIVAPFINTDKKVETYEDALNGALDIIAEILSDNETIRSWIRDKLRSAGRIVSKVKKDWKEKESKFRSYYDFCENLKESPSHRMLAIQRGTKENVLSWKIDINEEPAIKFMESFIIKNKDFIFYDELSRSIYDSYKRLLFPSIEKEVFNLKIEEAEKEAIKVFSRNLRNLLLKPPAGNRVIMGVDPGFRTGCKVCIIDPNGDYKQFSSIYPHAPQNKKDSAEKIILDFISKYNVEIISIGNGTASKETDIFIREIIKKNDLKVGSVVVSEAGASVYSASPGAVKELPDLDVTIRGAISIARRLQDPLAELVKIDPKSIGVGQYQHDVNQKELKKSLDLTVESCVNFVGVELNTASAELLSYASGINKKNAENIVKYRSENGKFKKRSELKKVPQLGPKAFEQCAGFLRIRESSNPLDNSAIHPETYSIVKKMAEDESVPLNEIVGNEKIISKINIKKYITDEFGILTLTDILNELKKPGIDPRKEFKSIEYSFEINEIGDLRENMILTGTVTNVTNFIGVHQNGLIHISKLTNRFVKDPHDIISVGDTVKTKVLSIDLPLKRISLERIE
jgi:uncharacterized protein